MELRPVEGYKHLFRDMETGAIVNMNIEASVGKKISRDKRQKQKEQLETNTNDINSIKSDVTEIKTMLKTMMEGK